MLRRDRATGSGKSYLDVMVTIPKRIEACRGEGLIVLFGNTRGTLERNILEPMREIWTPQLVGGIRSDNTMQIFGKKCYVLGADNKKHVQRIQGSTIEYAYGDEVTTWSEEVFQMLKSRLRCEHSHFDGTCNPGSPTHWFKKFLESDADIYEQNYIIDDGVLPEKTIAELKKEYAGTVFYDRFILGKWALAEGLIFPMYESALAYPPTGQKPIERVLSIDYGTLNAFAALLWERYGSVWYAVKGYYYSGRKEQFLKTDSEYANEIERNFGEFADVSRKLSVIVDPSAASFIAELRRRGKYAVRQALNNVEDGIRETAVALQCGYIKISPNIKEWKEEAAGYVWDKDALKDAPVKENDHMMDAMRYFVMTMRIMRKQQSYNDTTHNPFL